MVAELDEVRWFIEHHEISGAGIGYVDAQLLASTALTGATTLWNADKRLAAIAARLDFAYPPGDGS